MGLYLLALSVIVLIIRLASKNKCIAKVIQLLNYIVNTDAIQASSEYAYNILYVSITITLHSRAIWEIRKKIPLQGYGI